MIDTDTIRECIEGLQRAGERISYERVSKVLGVSPATVGNVRRGTYRKGRPYSDTPHSKRLIDNRDFMLIQGLFG